MTLSLQHTFVHHSLHNTVKLRQRALFAICAQWVLELGVKATCAAPPGLAHVACIVRLL